MRVLVTGASGFIGGFLCPVLEKAGHTLVSAVRSIPKSQSGIRQYVVVGNIGSSTDWMAILQDVDVVIHLAARVHVMTETADAPVSALRMINVYGTERLARQAAEIGVKRLVYVSSIKVNGEATNGIPFSADDAAQPLDAYGVSKFEAEQKLEKISEETGLEVVIVRPPLVYGPGVGGNFICLLQHIDRELPLPFGRVDNHRSLLNVSNLCDFLNVCVSHSNAAGQVFLVSDSHDVSTRDLILGLASEMRKSVWLLPIPVGLLRFVGKLFGKQAEMDRLCGSLQLDIEKTRRMLSWEPRFTLGEGLQETVTWYMSQSCRVTKI